MLVSALGLLVILYVSALAMTARAAPWQELTRAHAPFAIVVALAAIWAVL